ncbi:MAG TPA: glycosyltransferase family 4 protein [Bryobacteraceae bacterium]|nr:glycosyltransferase family 4 protein [Bryobacteraceae bacterium]
MKETSRVDRIAFIGDYLPRKCGIATFTSDILRAVAAAHPKSECFAVAVNDVQGVYDYPEEVRFEIDEQDLSSYLRAADFLNISDVDVVCLQHEFGIYGGAAGSHILAMLRDLRMPIITTFHTVLQNPKADQRRVMQELISLSTRVVVMAERGRDMLQEIYHAPAGKIDLVPHGIPDVAFADSADFKEQFGVADKIVLLTFGLLSPNKGIEHVINSLPGIVAEFPDVVYIVLGATHPNEVRNTGESYRVSLEVLARKNKVEKNVIFYDQFVDLETLKEFIGAADIYVTPYLNEAQITSGTLAYTYGAGKAVISTPYWHAAELLAEGRGVLVPFADAPAIANAVLDLLRNGERREGMRQRAYQIGRGMIWSNVATQYMRAFRASRVERAALSRRYLVKTLDQKPHELPKLNLDHLSRMTDSTGMFQHAIFSTPNFSEGYCADDNARAFIFTILGQCGEEPEPMRSLATTYLAFLHYSFDSATRRFHNHMSFDRNWLDDRGSEDCHGRVLWALGVGVGRSQLRSFQMMTGQLFTLALPAVAEFTSPRAWAFSLLGIDEYLQRLNGDTFVTQMRDLLMDRLVGLYEKNASDGWCWFEESLSYDNAKLAHALIASGSATGRMDVRDKGLRALRWLNEIQITAQNHFRPIGSNGFYRRGGPRAEFDQQPIEAHAMVSACLEAYRATEDGWWYEQAQRAFDWFVGWNDLGLDLYSSENGGCRDGLHSDRVNSNQGAESTLAFLLSLVDMRRAQDMVLSFRQSTAVNA